MLLTNKIGKLEVIVLPRLKTDDLAFIAIENHSLIDTMKTTHLNHIEYQTAHRHTMLLLYHRQTKIGSEQYHQGCHKQMRNTKGPKTDPWGTPLVTGRRPDC